MSFPHQNPFSLKLERTSTQYAIEIPDEDMRALLGAEDFAGDLMDPVLSEKLAGVPGVDDVEYNGHFGSAVYLRLDAEHDVPATHAAVITLIREHLAECRQALEARDAPKP